jgi:hypothetical protein
MDRYFLEVSVEKDNQSKIWRVADKILCEILIAAFLYIVGQKAYMIINYGTPQELREMNTIVFADAFARGENLYALSVLENAIPAATSMYGFLAPLLMNPFVKLFSMMGWNAVQSCEFMTLLVEVAGAAFFFRILYRKTASSALSAAGMLLFYTCYWRCGAFGGAFPDAWGLTLSIILMDLIHRDEERQRYCPVLYAGILVGMFYTKQYFVLVTIGLCVYLFVRSRRDVWKLIVSGILLTAVSVIVVQIVFPLYFSEILPIAQGQTITGSRAYSWEQLSKLSLYYKYSMLLALAGFFTNLYFAWKDRTFWKGITYEGCQILFSLPLLFRIAENQGTNYTYYIQLWFPYIFAYSMISVVRIAEYMKFAKKGKTVYYTVVWLILLLALNGIRPSFRVTLMTQQQQKAWDNAYAILDRYAAQGDILVPMHLSEYCIENNIPTASYGQAEYNDSYNLESYRKNKIWRNIPWLSYTEDILIQNIEYQEKVREDIANHRYRCVAYLYQREYGITEDDLVNAGYHAVASEELVTGEQNWNTTFYVYE